MNNPRLPEKEQDLSITTSTHHHMLSTIKCNHFLEIHYHAGTKSACFLYSHAETCLAGKFASIFRSEVRLYEEIGQSELAIHIVM
jgi:hypothetical protein